ncbi:thioredoxin fold domain-containing protein [bacterium]|nr:thioredoxin fold domain-containing protein [bacterium]
MKAATSLLLLLLLAAPLAAADTVLYCFTADWCVYCHQMKPVIARMQQAGYPVQVVDRDKQPQMAQQMGVRGLPYFVLVSDRQIVDSIEGATSFDRLTGMFHVAKPQIGPPQGVAPMQQRPPAGLTRGQSPQNPAVQPAVFGQQMNQPMPQSEGTIHATAMQASVRLKVADPDGNSYGSGTVIHTQSNESLVLTCAHLFRDSQGKGPLEVTTFHQSEAGTNVPGQLLVYDLDRDVALVSIRTQSPITPIPLAQPQHTLQVGQKAFSVGCDNGGPRNLYASRINSLNRYVGHDNVQAAGAPAVGRSGGGLFSPQGELVGVCNAADDKDNEGIYAAIPTIYAVINKANLAHLFRNRAPVQLASNSVPVSNQVYGSMPSAPANNIARGQSQEPSARPIPRPTSSTMPSGNMPGANMATSGNIDSIGGLSQQEREMLHYLRGQKTGAEVTIVLRSKDTPTAQPAVFRLPSSPSPAFMQQASQYSGNSGPIMRGQSNQRQNP